MTSPASSQSGNIVVYVLGAIFLMGLLIVMVRGSNAPGANVDAEELIIRVSEVQQYGAELERAANYIVRNGYSESDIRFAHPDAHATYSSNGNITSTPGRQIFSREGGGAVFRAPPRNIQSTITPWVFNGANIVDQIGTTCAPTNAGCADLLVILPNVTKAFCVALNKSAGIDNPSGNPPRDVSTADVTAMFTGTYTGTQTLLDSGNLLRGRKEGCFEGGGTPATGTYHYYRVLLAR